MPNRKLPLIWDINLPVLKNPLLWWQVLVVALLVFAFMGLLLIGMNLIEYQWQEIPTSIAVAATIGGGFFVVISLVVILFFGHGVATSYVLTTEHIEQHTLSKENKFTKLLLYVGVLFANPAVITAKGAGLLAKSRAVIAVKWQDINAIDCFPNRNEIHLKNDWRTVMQVICSDNDYSAIKQIIDSKVKTHQVTMKTPEYTTTVAKKLLLTLVVIGCGAVLFFRLPIHYVGVFCMATVLSALIALWAGGVKKLISALLLLLLPLVAVMAAFNYGEVDFTQAGWVYALSIELLSMLFFMFLALSVLRKKIV